MQDPLHKTCILSDSIHIKYHTSVLSSVVSGLKQASPLKSGVSLLVLCPSKICAVSKDWFHGYLLPCTERLPTSPV